MPEAATSGGLIQAGDVFPDLHHKMSKKIAQLTKVIYHLNTKNEDRQARASCSYRAAVVCFGVKQLPRSESRAES